MILVLILLMILLLLLPLYACVRISSPYERASDDEKQMEFLREHRKN